MNKLAAITSIIMLLGAAGNVNLAASTPTPQPPPGGRVTFQGVCGVQPALLSSFIKECPYLSVISSILQGIENAIKANMPEVAASLPISMSPDIESMITKASPRFL